MSPSKPRYLTKSRFKLANECATKLFYTHKKDVYQDSGLEDEFLAALAEGGFQVGELAKCLHPRGHDIEALDYETSLAQTAELLKQDEVTIFEPAFLFGNCFVRVDVLVKKGNSVDLLEVKSKSCRAGGESQFLGKKPGSVQKNWIPYLEDVVFQHYVVSGAHPEWEVRPFLMLVNKDATCPTDGLHQKFLLQRDERDRAKVTVTTGLTPEELASDLLLKIPLRNSREVKIS